MTRTPTNPYAHPEPPGYPAAPARTSVLAVSSLIASLLCCIPGVGVIGTVLGVGALASISSSQGRVGGRGLAFTGIILGLLGTMLWVGIGAGASWTLGQLDVYGRGVLAMQEGRHDDGRAVLEPYGGAPVDYATMDAFAARVTSEWGELQGLPRGLGGYFSAYGQIQGGGDAMEQAEKVYTSVMPVPVKFANGTTTMVVVFGESQGPGGFMPRLRDVGVQAKDGSIIWLHGAPSPP